MKVGMFAVSLMIIGVLCVALAGISRTAELTDCELQKIVGRGEGCACTTTKKVCEWPISSVVDECDTCVQSYMWEDLPSCGTGRVPDETNFYNCLLEYSRRQVLPPRAAAALLGHLQM